MPEMPEQPDPLPAPPPAPPAPAMQSPLAAPVAPAPKAAKLRKGSKRGKLQQAGSGAEQLRIDLDPSITQLGISTNTGTSKKGKAKTGVNVGK
tara:strand:+ start:1025 stop:1303 length:279 start_codon:yes stop_codon:yes gene_type:complete